MARRPSLSPTPWTVAPLTSNSFVSSCCFFSSRRRHTILQGDCSSDVCSSDLLCRQIRGFLMERGITIRKGPSHLTTQLQGVLEDANSLLSGRLRLLILELKHEWDELDKRIENSNAELQRIAKQDDACHRLMEIPGFGPLVSTALVATIGNGITFRKGRDL